MSEFEKRMLEIEDRKVKALERIVLGLDNLEIELHGIASAIEYIPK